MQIGLFPLESRQRNDVACINRDTERTIIGCCDLHTAVCGRLTHPKVIRIVRIYSKPLLSKEILNDPGRTGTMPMSTVNFMHNFSPPQIHRPLRVKQKDPFFNGLFA
jgi:hypothetical protein